VSGRRSFRVMPCDGPHLLERVRGGPHRRLIDQPHDHPPRSAPYTLIDDHDGPIYRRVRHLPRSQLSERNAVFAIHVFRRIHDDTPKIHYILQAVMVSISCLLSFSFFLFPRLFSAVADWMPDTILPHMVWSYSANLECRYKSVLHAARGNRGRKISRKNRHLRMHHRTTLSGYIFATKARIDNRKNLLNNNISPTCPHNMVNFGPLAA